MVAPISVFPDVGAAFFGSYRGARNQRLQESAMRAEMAAAQAERQRQSQAREAFARLQGPDQRIEQVAGSTNFGPSPVEFTQDRITRQGLTPEQRAFEEQRLAQNDPNLLMAYRQTRQGPEARDYSDIYQIQANRVANGNATVEEAARIVAGLGGNPNIHAAEIQARVQQQEADRVNGTIVQTEQGQILINPQTGEQIAQYGNRPRQARGPLVRVEGDRPDRGLPVGTPLTGAALNDFYGVDAYPVDGLFVAGVSNTRGDQPIEPYEAPEEGGEEDPNPNAGLPAGSVYSEVALEETQFGQSLLSENPNSVTGYMGIVRAFADPTSEAGQFRSTLMTLKSNAAFDRLQYIRDNSPTGGAVGQVSNYEQEMLQAAIGNIDQANDPALLARRLARYEAILTAASTGVVYDEASDSFRLATVADARAGRVTGLGYNEADRENGLGRGRNQRNITLREVYEITGINPEDAYRAINADVAGELSPAARGWLEGTPLRNGQ